MKKYILTSTTYHTGEGATFYGIALIEKEGNSYELIASFNDLTDDKSKAQKVVNLCNESNLSTVHLKNVIQDLMSD